MKYRRFFLLIFIVLISGCAHKYSESEYNTLSKELKICKQKQDEFVAENEKLRGELLDVVTSLKGRGKDIDECMKEKQECLDKNIESLENNKMLLEQMTNFKSIYQDKRDSQKKLVKSFDYLIGYFEAEKIKDKVYAIKYNGKIKIVVQQRVLFPNAKSAWLTPDGIRLLQKIAKGIKNIDAVSVEIGGHTDNTPMPENLKKTYPSNWYLAEARSLSVLGIFEAQGIKRDRLSAVSYADTKPILDNNTPDGGELNRRVEIILQP